MFIGIGHEGEVEVAHVMVDCAAAGYSPHYANAVLPSGIQIYLCRSVLIPADNYGVIVLPKQEIVFALIQVREDISIKTMNLYWN